MSSHVDANVARAIAALTAIHDDHPVHRRRDLLARGMPDMLQVAMIRRGQLVRLRHGIYTLASLVADADAAERHRIDLAAALAATHEPSWGFGASAALLHGFPLPFVVPARLSVVRGSGLDERGLRQPSRHRLNLPEADVTTGPIEVGCTTIVRGVATVGPELAALSTAATLSSSRWRTALFDAALWTGGTVAEIERLVEMWRHLGHRSEVLASLARARWGAQTVLETFSRLALIEQGIPEPMLQHPFADDRGPIGVVDMWWPELGVIGEADGAVKYQSRDDLLREKVREDRLRALGWAVVRWTFPDIEERPQLVAASIRRARRVAA
jgi:hypothetical protein